MRKKLLFFSFLLALDVFTKLYAIDKIPPLQSGGYPFGGVPLFNDFLGISFSLNTIFNTGAAWGLFAQYPEALFAVRILFVLGFSLYFFFFKKTFIQVSAFWLIAVGALGNALDYLMYGHVVDFLHFVFWGYSFPIFNLADSFICLGVFLLYFFSPFRAKTFKNI